MNHAPPSCLGSSQAPQGLPLFDGVDGFVGGFGNSERGSFRPLLSVPVKMLTAERNIEKAHQLLRVTEVFGVLHSSFKLKPYRALNMTGGYYAE